MDCLWIPLSLQEVLKQAVVADGLCRGLKESTRALDSRGALLAVLADNCDQQGYKQLVIALCAEHGIPLIKVKSEEKRDRGRIFVDSNLA